MIDDNDYLFSNLYRRALNDWTAEITKKRQQLNNPLYYPATLDEFYDMSDDISTCYIGHQEEVLMRNLHDVIYCLINQALKSDAIIHIEELNVEEVKGQFNDNLNLALEREALGWLEADKQLIHAYFNVNQLT